MGKKPPKYCPYRIVPVHSGFCQSQRRAILRQDNGTFSGAEYSKFRSMGNGHAVFQVFFLHVAYGEAFPFRQGCTDGHDPFRQSLRLGKDLVQRDRDLVPTESDTAFGIPDPSPFLLIRGIA